MREGAIFEVKSLSVRWYSRGDRGHKALVPLSCQTGHSTTTASAVVGRVDLLAGVLGMLQNFLKPSLVAVIRGDPTDNWNYETQHVFDLNRLRRKLQMQAVISHRWTITLPKRHTVAYRQPHPKHDATHTMPTIGLAYV